MKKCLAMALLFGIVAACGSLPIIKKYKEMNAIEFVPKEFEDVVLEYKNVKMCPCSPGYPQKLEVNRLLINMPNKVIFHIKDENFTPVLPICLGHTISYRRSMKYYYSSEKRIHVRLLDDNEVHTGDIYDKSLEGHTLYNYDTDHSIAQRKKRIEEAQNFTDEELDNDSYSITYYNIDLFEFVNIPVKSCFYEVWITYYGLESNHAIVEIVVE